MTRFRLDDPAAFIRTHTALLSAPLVPEIRLYLASEDLPIWTMTEDQLAEAGLPPPFWAFAWAGGQALARYVLDHRDIVAGKSVLDFGAGSGIVGLAAMKAGAASATGADIDPVAAAAMALNAAANDVSLCVETDDLVGQPTDSWDVILVGDMCYEQPLAGRIEAWLAEAARAGRQVLIGDPGRTYLPKNRLEKIISYGVKTARALEDTDVRNACVWALS